MPHLEDLEARRQAIRLPIRSLAEAAGLDEHTVGRVLAGRGGLVATVEKLGRAIEAQEQELLAHLMRIHGGQRQ